MEPGQPEMVDAGEDDQKVVIPAAPRAVDAAGGQQQRGIKRTRRDRGSTAKERISKMPPCAAGKRSSIYRGVTRHRWTGRYEAHLWDKSTWNQSQNKKGKQVYLGAYDEEEAAARAYDLAALRYWGPGTLINFPLTDYARDVEEMQNVTREEYLASLRRKSSGFSRGVSKYRGVARHHHNGRWEARIGRVFGNKYLYLGTYGTQEEAAAAYDMAAIEYRGLNAVTNFDLSRYIRWLRPGQNNSTYSETETTLSPSVGVGGDGSQLAEEAHGGQGQNQQKHSIWSTQSTGPYYRGLGPVTTQDHSSASPSALSLLLQSSMFKQMMERAAASTEYESNSTDPSEVSNQIEQQQQQQHDHQQIDSNTTNNNRLNYPAWGKQASHQQHTGSPVEEDEVAVHHNKHEDFTSYHQAVTSNYEGVVGHFAELEDQKQQQAAQRYQKLQRQQHQVDHLTAATVYGHGAYSGSHGPVPSLYSTEQESGGVSASLEDGNWTFRGVLPPPALLEPARECGPYSSCLALSIVLSIVLCPTPYTLNLKPSMSAGISL